MNQELAKAEQVAKGAAFKAEFFNTDTPNKIYAIAFNKDKDGKPDKIYIKTISLDLEPKDIRKLQLFVLNGLPFGNGTIWAVNPVGKDKKWRVDAGWHTDPYNLDELCKIVDGLKQAGFTGMSHFESDFQRVKKDIRRHNKIKKEMHNNTNRTVCKYVDEICIEYNDCKECEKYVYKKEINK